MNQPTIIASKNKQAALARAIIRDGVKGTCKTNRIASNQPNNARRTMAGSSTCTVRATYIAIKRCISRPKAARRRRRGARELLHNAVELPASAWKSLRSSARTVHRARSSYRQLFKITLEPANHAVRFSSRLRNPHGIRNGAWAACRLPLHRFKWDCGAGRRGKRTPEAHDVKCKANAFRF